MVHAGAGPEHTATADGRPGEFPAHRPAGPDHHWTGSRTTGPAPGPPDRLQGRRAGSRLTEPQLRQLVGLPEDLVRPADRADLAAFAAAFVSCLKARTLARDSGPVMSATDR